MKIVVVWLCLLTKASAFPTEPPPNAEEKKPCCVGPPRLLFKGYHTKHGINVFLFEFPPMKDGSKSHVKDENVEHSNTESEGTSNSFSNTGDGSHHEVPSTETNTPAYSSGFNVIPTSVSHFTKVSDNTVDTKKRDAIFPGIFMTPKPVSKFTDERGDTKKDATFTGTTPMNSNTVSKLTDVSIDTDAAKKKDAIFSGTSVILPPANIHQREPDLETNSSPITVTQNDTENSRRVNEIDITVGDEAKMTEGGITNGHNDVDGYYSTEGITLTDISGYSDNKDTKQDPNVSFPSKDVESVKKPGCSETDGLCKNTSKDTEHKQVTHPKTHKVQYATAKSSERNVNVTQSSKSHANKASGRYKKPVTHKDKINRQPDQPNVNSRQSPRKYYTSTNRNAKHSSTQRQRYAHYDSRYIHHRRHHKKSSSESTSDSSQQFD